MKLYYYEGSTRKGPIPSVRLRELARKGEVAPETLIETVLGMRFRADEAGSYVSGLSLEKEFANLRAVPPEPSQEREIKPEIKPKAGAAVVPAPELEAEFDAGPAEPKAEPAPAVEFQPASVSAEPEPRKTVSGSSVSAAKRPLEDKAPSKDAPEDAIEWKELELIDVQRREMRLRTVLATSRDQFDFIFMDCPPSLGVLTLIALTASDGVIVPVKADYLALKGMSQLVDVINVVKRRMNPGLVIVGVIAPFFNSRRNLDQQIVEQIETFFPGKLFETKISQNTALAEAPSQGKNIFEYDSRSKGAQQYRTLAEELIEREDI